MNSDQSDQFDVKELDSVKSAIVNLIETHWQGILHGIKESESRIGGVSISIKLDHRGNMSRHIKTRISYAVRTADEAETIIDDPMQPELQYGNRESVF